MKKILTIAAHPDDEILGLGATIRQKVDLGDKAKCIILGEGLTSREENRTKTSKKEIDELHKNTLDSAKIIGYDEVYFASFPDNRFDSVNLLEIIKYIEKYILLFKPDIVYTHYYGDRNIDHRITYDAVMTATRPTNNNSVKEIYTFETPSSTEWGFNGQHMTFNPNVFVDVKNTFSNKLKAMSCYKSELRDYPHPRSLKSLEIIAKRWGTVVDKEFVEAFQLIRKID